MSAGSPSTGAAWYATVGTPSLERILARIVLAVPAYGHFCVEHNRGHHTEVATPEDPASSRMGGRLRS